MVSGYVSRACSPLSPISLSCDCAVTSVSTWVSVGGPLPNASSCADTRRLPIQYVTSDVGLFGGVGSRGVQDHVSLSECAYLTCLPPPAFSYAALMESLWKRYRSDVWLKLGTLSSVFLVAVVLVRSPCQFGVLLVDCSLIHFCGVAVRRLQISQGVIVAERRYELSWFWWLSHSLFMRCYRGCPPLSPVDQCV